MFHGTTVYLARHGETEWNVQRRMQGHRDSPLTLRGVKQALWLGETLSRVPLDAIYASSSGRALQTAEYIRGRRAIPVIARDRLREMHLGTWEGMERTFVQETYPEEYERFWRDPEACRPDGGESFDEVSRRALAELTDIVASHRDRTVLIVTHTVVLKLLMAHFEGRPWNQLWDPPYIYPACLCQIQFPSDGSRPDIALHGDISHYREPAAGH